MPKLIGNILAVSKGELEASGIDWNTAEKGIERNSACWQQVEDPADRRTAWVAYHALKPKYKALVDGKLGNVQALAEANKEEEEAQTLAKLARSKFDNADFDYFRYKKGLPQQKAASLAQGASWLRVLCAETRGEVAEYGIKGVEFKGELLQAVWCAIQDAPPAGLSVKGHALSLGRLKNKGIAFRTALKEGREKALDLLLGGHIGNANSKKLIGDEQHSLLRQLYGRHQAFNYVAIMDDYNKMATAKGWPCIGHTTVADWCKKYRKQVGSTRLGTGEWKQRTDFVIKGARPSAPLFRVESDGTPVELYFKKVVKTKAGNDAHNPWGRLVGVVVLDAFNEYPLGYAMGETESADLIRAAYRDAVAHIKEITGGYYLPWQIKADHFAKVQMGALYTALAAYPEVFATVGNAREKAIEGWWARSKEKHLTKYPNFSGYNITAKREQPNRQYLDKISSQFPDEMGVRAQFDAFIQEVRSESVNGKPRQQAWLEAFHALPEADKRVCDRLKFLDVLGEGTGYTNRLTNRGVEVTLLGHRRTYMLLNHSFYETLGADYSIRYDANDLDTVLAVGEQGMFLLNQTKAVPMAFKDMTEEDKKNLHRQLGFKQKQKHITLVRNAEDWVRIADLAESDPEAGKILGNAFAGKHLQQQAENLLKSAGKYAQPEEEEKPAPTTPPPPSSRHQEDDTPDTDRPFSPSEYLKNSRYNF